MKTFSKFLIENQINLPDDNSYSLLDDFNKNKDKMKKFKGNIFRYRSIYYLVKDGKYVAALENYADSIEDKTINIDFAHSNVRGGYKELLLGLLGSKVERIISDSTLTKKATKFWLKIISDSSVNKILVNSSEKTIFSGAKFDKEQMDLFKNLDMRIGISL